MLEASPCWHELSKITEADSSVYIAPVIKVMSFQRCQQFLQHVCELLSAEELRRADGSVTVIFAVLTWPVILRRWVREQYYCHFFIFIWRFSLGKKGCVVNFLPSFLELAMILRDCQKEEEINFMTRELTKSYLPNLKWKNYWEVVLWGERNWGTVGLFGFLSFSEAHSRAEGRLETRGGCLLVSKLLFLVWVFVCFSSQNIQKSALNHQFWWLASLS